VVDWANEDLLAVLDREGVDEFMITGHSQGTPHAMAVAYVHPDRCVGLGLNAPLLPTAVCHEEGLQGALGADSLFSTTTLAKPYMAWYFTVHHLGVVTISPALSIRPLISAGPKLKEEPEFLERLRDTLRRSVIRGSVGGAWESAGDVCYEWGFDPREIQAINV
jgi:pimeloyl-ACP methyl ester carboxylesterase